MIEIENLNKSFLTGSNDKIQVLHNLSLSLKKGEYTMLIGSNGSGKSTLLNIIAGNIQPDSGNIYFANSLVNAQSDFQRAGQLTRIFQNPIAGTAPDLTILENFRLAYLRRRSKKLKLGITNSFKKLVTKHLNDLDMGLEFQLNREVKQLSGGQRQALTLSMAMIDPPKYLLLDEPTAALDPDTAQKVLSLANHYIRKHQITALHITHNLREAIDYGDRLVLLKSGSIDREVSNNQKQNLSIDDVMLWYHKE